MLRESHRLYCQGDPLVRDASTGLLRSAGRSRLTDQTQDLAAVPDARAIRRAGFAHTLSLSLVHRMYSDRTNTCASQLQCHACWLRLRVLFLLPLRERTSPQIAGTRRAPQALGAGPGLRPSGRKSPYRLFVPLAFVARSLSAQKRSGERPASISTTHLPRHSPGNVARATSAVRYGPRGRLRVEKATHRLGTGSTQCFALVRMGPPSFTRRPRSGTLPIPPDRDSRTKPRTSRPCRTPAPSGARASPTRSRFRSYTACIPTARIHALPSSSVTRCQPKSAGLLVLP
jgi:hypothetical protein